MSWSALTRTTHPRVLDALRGVVGALDIGVELRNPFDGKTKGEIMAEEAAA